MRRRLMGLCVCVAFALTGGPSLAFEPRAERIGDPAVSYTNIEVSPDGRWMVWFEMDRSGRATGTQWHCAIDPETGAMIPADGRGFRAFETTIFARGNPGQDANGHYYVGADRDGRLIRVDIVSATEGKVTVLPVPADTRRRAIYPTKFDDREGGWAYWIRNDKVAGGGLSNANDNFALEVVDLSDLARVRVIEEQAKPTFGFAPMDVGFVRWMGGKPIVTYGSKDQDGTVQIRAWDASTPDIPPVFLTADDGDKVDPYPWSWGGVDYLLPGIEATDEARIYTRDAVAGGAFVMARTIRPEGSALGRPGLAQSFEPFGFEGVAYAAYQVNNRPLIGDFYSVTFREPGEIWLTTLPPAAPQQWRLSGSDRRIAEPEPVVGTNRAWVYFSAPPEGGREAMASGLWELYRAETPVGR